MSVLVLGAGVAGVAAAFAARRAGKDVTVVHGRAGATALYSGALETTAPEADDTELVSFARELGCWQIGASDAVVVTDAGVVRSCRGRDAALLDLSPLRGQRVAVLDTRIPGWNGIGMARTLIASDWAARTETTFESVPVEMTDVPRGSFPPFDLARRFDDAETLRDFAERVRAAGSGQAGWLVGPWLGTTPDVAQTLSEAVGAPCGEVTSPPDGAAGARFEVARAALFRQLGVTEVRADGRAVRRAGDAWELLCDDDRVLRGSAVVLAVGGVVGGGIVLRDPRQSEQGHFDLCLEAPVTLGLDGQRLGAASTLHGVDLEHLGLGALERVGVVADDVRVPGAPGLFVAGDCVEGASHRTLDAARSGLRAGRAAAG